eukprot:6192397-Pleurochrysis_carterae.AAC.1
MLAVSRSEIDHEGGALEVLDDRRVLARDRVVIEAHRAALGIVRNLLRKGRNASRTPVLTGQVPTSIRIVSSTAI